MRRTQRTSRLPGVSLGGHAFLPVLRQVANAEGNLDRQECLSY